MPSTVLITGSSSGFGRAAVDRFLTAGWNVVATLRDPAAWQGEPSDQLLVQALDVRDEESVATGVTAAVERFGVLDVVINNAGIGLFGPFEASPAPLVHEVFDTNVFGPMRVIRQALPVFRGQGHGRFVNLSSGNATVPMPLQSVYSASKSALYAFSESLTHELAGQNIQIKVVEPGFVPDSNFFSTTYGRYEGLSVPEAYQPTVRATLAGFADQPPAGYLATSADVAQALLDAATDTSGRLRSRVGQDSHALEQARRQSDADYDAWRETYFSATASSRS
ncbi:SDR family oxidoreductase [Kineosporia sp. J2-2]|uniref:SDR family oxidoreductase n=1 Tax=Kineosporia corallincola TaxID=2835133 RepID=A0ABS5TGM3_9ACTN|nr:SDR family oxidoreductase [Kineosporia corallincola]MBT0770240.1 SDR family oxidoreductase [Kineosporia corallincola]